MRITQLEITAAEIIPPSPAQLRAIRARLYGKVTVPPPEPAPPAVCDRPQEPEVPEKPPIVIDKYGMRWSKEEIEIIARGFAENWSGHQFMTALPGRDKKSIQTKARRLGFGYIKIVVAIEPAPAKASGKPQFADIMREVSAKYSQPVKMILSRCRWRDVSAARNELAYRARLETELSLPDIGRRIGRDHTTVLHSIRTHARRILSEKESQGNG
jgi:chromosomal replication initiation ATPase DnaA